MGKFKLNDVVKYNKKGGLYIVVGVDQSSDFYRGKENIKTLFYSITIKSEYDNWKPLDLSTLPKNSYSNVSEEDLKKVFE